MESQIQTLPLLPAHTIKYIVSFHNIDADFVLNVFKAFTFGIENDDEPTRDYKEYVQQHIAHIVFEFLDGYCLLTEETEFNLSANELMCVYEVMFGDHYAQTYGGITQYLYGGRKDIDIDVEFMDCTYLLELTRLTDDEEIMNDIGVLNIGQIKYMRLLENALLNKSADLLKFIRKHMYSPIMAFYIYLKHNHNLYRENGPSCLASDDWLINLLLEENCREEFLCLSLSGIYPIHCWSYNAEHNVVFPNLEVVKKIVPEFIKPTYYIPASLCPIDPDGDYPLQINTPLQYWENYPNTRSIKITGSEKRTCVLPKDERIRDYLISVS